MFRVAVISCLLAFVTSQTTDVSQCISNPGELPMNVYIDGCIDPPCVLPQLQNVVINMIFKAPRTIRSLRTLATAYMSLGIITVPIPYDLQEQAITCNFLTNTYCPVLQDEVVTYTLHMLIESFMPAGKSVTIEFRVVDDSTPGTLVPLLCLRVPIRIVNPIEPMMSANAIANATITQH